MSLQALIAKAETGDDWAEICRLEALQNGGPFYCACGCEVSADDIPCEPEHGVCTVKSIQIALYGEELECEAKNYARFEDAAYGRD
jgi:hypothetical protein